MVQAFTEFASAKAEAFAVEADLARPNPLEVNPIDKNAIVDWLEDNEQHLGVEHHLREPHRGGKIAERSRCSSAPSGCISAARRNSPYGMLSLAFRELGQADEELAVLENWATIEDCDQALRALDGDSRGRRLG